MGRVLLANGLAAVALLAAANPAPAAVTIGSTLSAEASSPVSCIAPNSCTLANSQLPSSQVTSPIDGVIVRWRTFMNEPPDTGLRVLRLVGNSMTAIRTTPTPIPPPASGVVSVVSVNPGVPIATGETIGIDAAGLRNVARPLAGASFLRTTPPLADGATATGMPNTNMELAVNADIEPDCDGDLLGDETQDASVDCEPSDTQITAGPKDKTKKKQTTFEFASSEPGSTFECSLDGASFTPCSSPDAFKVKKGKHAFSVRAIDPAGNVDASPATDDWKVKKKRKRR